MARRAAASTLMRRLLSTTTPPPRFAPPFFCPARSCCGGGSAAGEGESELSKPPYNMISYMGDWRLTEKAMKHPGMDYKHWFVQMSKPGGEGATEQQIIQCFVKTLARVLPRTLSRTEIKEKIYKVEFGPEISGFGCEVDWATKDELEEFPGVVKVSEDYYPDPKYKDYGGELFVNGEIVKRSEREPKSRDQAVDVCSSLGRENR